jgi:hypothetical protein
MYSACPTTDGQERLTWRSRDVRQIAGGFFLPLTAIGAQKFNCDPQGRVDKVGIALGGADLCVVKASADPFQWGVARDHLGGRTCSAIMNASVGDLASFRFIARTLWITDRLVGNLAGITRWQSTCKIPVCAG